MSNRLVPIYCRECGVRLHLMFSPLEEDYEETCETYSGYPCLL